MLKKYKTGLVLSGGGTRGFAHLGVLSALYEAEIIPDVISGVSAGAIVGAFIASGKSPVEIKEILNKGTFFKYTRMQIPKDGLFKLDGLKEVIQKEIGLKNIEDLKIPLFMGISNLNKGKMEYRNSGNLADIVLASASIPILFSPVKIDSDLYVDGGLLDNIPIKPILKDCDQIITVNISPVVPEENLKNLKQIASRTFYMSVNAAISEVKKASAIYIEPEGIEKYEILSMSHTEELFNLGYTSTKKILENLKLLAC